MQILADKIRARIEIRSDLHSNECRIWTGMVDSMGYAKAKLAPHWPKGARVSRMILAIKLGRVPTKDEWACHSCDNILCVNEGHIYLGNALTNNRDTVVRGRRTNGFGKTDDKIKAEIRILYLSGSITQEELGKQYGVTQVRISQIIREEVKCQVKKTQ